MSGSETSKAAAKRAYNRRETVARHIFDILAKAGAAGMTVDELDVIFEPLGERHNVVGPRTKDLADRGMVTRGPDKRLTRKDSDADICRVVPEAVGNFDAMWKRRFKRSPTERAVGAFKAVTKQLSQQAMEHTLPSFANAEGLVLDALRRIYVTLP